MPALRKNTACRFRYCLMPSGEVAEQYECLTDWKGMKIAARHTFIVDPHGKVAKIYREVDPDTHSAQVLADLASLQAD